MSIVTTNQIDFKDVDSKLFLLETYVGICKNCPYFYKKNNCKVVSMNVGCTKNNNQQKSGQR